VAPAVFEPTTHPDESLHFLLDKSSPVESRMLVGARLQECEKVRSETNECDHHAPVSCTGQRATVRREAVVGRFPSKLDLGTKLKRDLMNVRPRTLSAQILAAVLGVAVDADRNVSAAVVTVQNLHSDDALWHKRIVHDSQDGGLTQVCEGVRKTERTNVVHVTSHVSVNEQLDGGGWCREQRQHQHWAHAALCWSGLDNTPGYEKYFV